MKQEGREAGVPVICIGNYHLGGAGKTPLAIHLIGLLREMGEKPVVLSRGYGGRMHGPVLVTDKHTARDVGDEPVMLSRIVPVVVSRDRVAGAERARAIGASVIVMDDGFQNPSLRKDLSIVVIGGRRGVGNGAVFPAGPLRAPLDLQTSRTDVLIVVGPGPGADGVIEMVKRRGVPVLRAQTRPHESSLAVLRGRRVLAFAGIGDPERFFDTLRAGGVDVVRTHPFPDHHAYTLEEIQSVLGQTAQEQLLAVTTEKDIVRLRDVVSHVERNIHAFAVTLEIDEADRLRAMISGALKSFRASKKP